MSGGRARTKRRAAAEEGERRDTENAPPADWVDGVPYIPDDEMDAAVDGAAVEWSELMRRLAE